MIHTLHTMSVRQYGQMDETENENLLRRWFNPFPLRWFNTDDFYADLRGALGDGSMNDVENEYYRLISYNKILMLDRMLRMMSLLMVNNNDRNLFALLFKRQTKPYTGNLNIYQKKVKAITGIDVEDGNDLKKLQKEVQRLLDKYNENFQAPKPQAKIDFTEIALGVFSIMEMSYVPDMKLSEFARLKKLAIKKTQPKDGKHE